MQQAPSRDKYIFMGSTAERLSIEYDKYPFLYIAFDFDNTVYDYHKVGDTFPKMESLLRHLKQSSKFKLILFTSREGTELDEAVEYCRVRGYAPDYVNESPVSKSRKPYYNLLLDDRAGLFCSFFSLAALLNKKENYSEVLYYGQCIT